MARIILRDVPKKLAQCNLWRTGIKGGFRGFNGLGMGAHYIAVWQGDVPVSFWTTISDSSEVQVWVFAEGAFTRTDDPDFVELAGSGAMDGKLMTYPPELTVLWAALTAPLIGADFPPPLHTEAEEGPGSRFDKALKGTHGGSADAFLREFAYAFAASYVDPQQQAAAQRWLHLLQAIYNAGEGSVREAPNLFEALVPIIITQMKLIKPLGEALTFGVGYIIEDMTDAGLEAPAKRLRDYMRTRGVDV